MTTVIDTKFCFEKIEFENNHLWIDGNQKITAGNGTYDNPMPNAFSLVQIEDCPFRTKTCEEACYVSNIEKFNNPIHEKYKHNSITIRKILDDKNKADLWSSIMGNWISNNAMGGFRWHVSGDVFSEQYAEFIINVCMFSKEVNHWIYTRSFPYVEKLITAKNLIVNLSADKDNYEDAMKTASKYGVRICYLTMDGILPNDLPYGSVIFPNYSLRTKETNITENSWWVNLPKNYKKMICPVDMFGKSENIRCGICVKCIRRSNYEF